MKTHELRELSKEELLAKLNQLKEELFNLRTEKAVKRLASPHRFPQVRHDIARILTLLRERELATPREAEGEP